jgi:hypothetical protein
MRMRKPPSADDRFNDIPARGEPVVLGRADTSVFDPCSALRAQIGAVGRRMWRLIKTVLFIRQVLVIIVSPRWEVPLDADIAIRVMRGYGCDLDGVKSPGKRNPAERFLAIQTGCLTDVPKQVSQRRREQCTECRIPDRHVLLS